MDAAPPLIPTAEVWANAQTVLAQQALEIESLKRQLTGQGLATELGAALVLAANAGQIATPVSHSRLLEMIVETAADVMSAESASLLLIDAEAQELIFEVALGPKGEEVRKMRVPLGHGIAGLVAISGQPMAVRNAAQDGRTAADIAERIGYHPESILCVPLFYHDSVIGVIELFNKRGQDGFNDRDIASLGLFANQAAVAIEQSRTHRNLIALLGETLRSLQGLTDAQAQGLQERMKAFAETMEKDPVYQRAMEFSTLVHEIVWQGENESRACLDLLRGFQNYLARRSGGWG